MPAPASGEADDTRASLTIPVPISILSSTAELAESSTPAGRNREHVLRPAGRAAAAATSGQGVPSALHQDRLLLLTQL